MVQIIYCFETRQQELIKCISSADSVVWNGNNQIVITENPTTSPENKQGSSKLHIISSDGKMLSSIPSEDIIGHVRCFNEKFIVYSVGGKDITSIHLQEAVVQRVAYLDLVDPTTERIREISFLKNENKILAEKSDDISKERSTVFWFAQFFL